MYLPDHFREPDGSALLAFIQEHDFATLITPTPDGIAVSHVPLLLRASAAGCVLAGHLARANDHWRAMDGTRESVAIFHGPHGYISPGWYRSSGLVPTWNYAVVHATGTPRARDESEFTDGVVRELTRRYEEFRSRPWRVEDLPPGLHERLLGAIVGFEMPVARLEGKFKLSQNRNREDLESAIDALETSGDPGNAALAALMRARRRE